MKRLFATTIVLISTIMILTACSGIMDRITSDSSSSEYEKGSFDETSFESKFLDLRFTLPNGFIMASEEEIKSMMEEESISSPTILYEMIARSQNGFPVVTIIVEKLAFGSVTLEQYIESFKKTLISDIDTKYEFFDDIETIEFVGHNYKQLTISMNVYGFDLTQICLFREIGNRIVCISTTNTTDAEDELNKLMNGFSTY